MKVTSFLQIHYESTQPIMKVTAEHVNPGVLRNSFEHGHRIIFRHLKLYPVPCGNIKRKHLSVYFRRAH